MIREGTPVTPASAGASNRATLIATLIAEADAVGLVSDREVREHQVEIRGASARGTVFALVVRGHVIGYAKPPLGGRGSRRPAQEALTTSRLASLDLGPRLHGDAEMASATIWTSALPGSALDQQSGSASDLAEVVQAWGLAVARLHTERSVRPPAPAPRPWVLGPQLRPPQQTMSRSVPLSPACAAVVRITACDPALRRAARQADDRWSESGWVHGDLSPEHVIVQGGAEVQVRFVDLGRAGAGDPSWDLACALETIVRLAPGWRVDDRVLSDYFLHGYRRGGGPGRLDPELRALRALEIAWQLAATAAGSGPGRVDEQVARWLDRARAYAGRSGQSSWAA